MKTLERLLKWGVLVSVLVKWAAVASMLAYVTFVGVYLILTTPEERAALASKRRAAEAAPAKESNAVSTGEGRADERPR